MKTSRKTIYQVCYWEDSELRVRFFDSPTASHLFAREHEPSIPSQATVQVANEDVHKPLSEILGAMHPEDRLDWAIANASQE